MFGSIGVFELIILAGIGLVVMGPEKFPDFARTVAKMIRDVRGYISDAQRDLERELRPIKKEFNQLSKVDPETYIDQLAKQAMSDEPERKKEEEKDTYNPEPEGPIVDGTFQYGSYGAKPESEAQATADLKPADAPKPNDSDRYAD